MPLALRLSSLALVALLVACDKGNHGTTHGQQPSSASSEQGAMHGRHEAMHGHHAMGAPGGSASALDEVARVHGGAGPWAVAGYRMGQFALLKLGLDRQSFDLDVTHKGPLDPQYACIADGASASTGASVGKVNLRLQEAAAADLATVYKRKSTGQTITLRPTEAFKQRFLNVPRPELRKAGEQVIALRDDEVFETVP